MFVEGKDILVTDKGNGITQRMLGYSEKLMMVELAFKKGAKFEPHKHENFSQAMYVLRGKFELTCGEIKRICVRGDCCYAPMGEVHGTLCLEDDSVLLDIHNPMRPDILEEGRKAKKS
jgi:quercetin dioxygenase-like cupin family protein